MSAPQKLHFTTLFLKPEETTWDRLQVLQYLFSRNMLDIIDAINIGFIINTSLINNIEKKFNHNSEYNSLIKTIWTWVTLKMMKLMIISIVFKSRGNHALESQIFRFGVSSFFCISQI